MDVPLAATGVAESHRAAAELKKENFEFDIVYTSCLKRAIKTAWNILEDLDQMYVFGVGYQNTLNKADNVSAGIFPLFKIGD